MTRIDARKLADHIIEFDFERKWLDDCILEVSRVLGYDELEVLDKFEEIKERVRNYIEIYEEDCRVREVYPKVKLIGNLVVGRQRPEIISRLHESIRNLDPYDFQRLCCVYTKEHLRLSVKEVKRNDGGADIIAEQRGIYSVVQSRRHQQRKVGKTELRQWLLQFKENYPGASGIFITSSFFTDDAREYAMRMYVKTIDGEQISHFLFRQNVLPSQIRNWLDNKCAACTHKIHCPF